MFECEVSLLLYAEGEVEYWMYEPVDLTEESATNAANSSTMQVEELCYLSSVSLNVILTHIYTFGRTARDSFQSRARPSLG